MCLSFTLKLMLYGFLNFFGILVIPNIVCGLVTGATTLSLANKFRVSGNVFENGSF